MSVDGRRLWENWTVGFPSCAPLCVALRSVASIMNFAMIAIAQE